MSHHILFYGLSRGTELTNIDKYMEKLGLKTDNELEVPQKIRTQDIIKIFPGYDRIYILTQENIYYVNIIVKKPILVKTGLILSKEYNVQNIVTACCGICIVHMTNGDAYLINDTPNIGPYSDSTIYKLDVPKIKTAVMGYYHYALVTYDNDIYIGGRNDDGQCGVINGKNWVYPTKLNLPAGVKIIKMDCTAHNVIILTNDGLYATGSNEYKLIGINDRLAFRRILSDYDIIDVWAFPVNIHIKTSDNKYYTFGRSGVCNRFLLDRRNDPDNIKIQLNYYLTDIQPINLFGWYTSFAIDKQGELYCDNSNVVDVIPHISLESHDMTVSFRVITWSPKLKLSEKSTDRQMRFIRENTEYRDIEILVSQE